MGVFFGKQEYSVLLLKALLFLTRYLMMYLEGLKKIVLFLIKSDNCDCIIAKYFTVNKK